MRIDTNFSVSPGVMSAEIDREQEHDPLLPLVSPDVDTTAERNRTIEANGGANGNSSQTNLRKDAHLPGPLEISRSNRYAILAGIWTATFLSVCLRLYYVLFVVADFM